MSDPIVRARNGDAGFFKRVPLYQILSPRDKDNDSVLSITVYYNHIHCSRVIFQRCPPLLYQHNEKKFTALHYAAWRGIPAIVKLFIHGAEKKLFRMEDEDGDTPIMTAVLHQHLEIVKLLLQADPDYVFPTNNEDGTPLLCALRLSYGKTSDDISVKIRQFLLENQPCQCKVRTGKNGWTALHHATSKGDLGAIEDIIQFCPESIDLVDKKGRNFLHIAIKDENVKVVEYIVREKEKVVGLLNSKNNKGDTPLDIATKNGNIKLISCLDYASAIAGYKNERERELCVPLMYLKLYRDLVRHFGEIVPPNMSLSLDEFLRIVFEMLNRNLDTVTQQLISFWEEKVGYYTSVGLQISWWQEYVTQLRDWSEKKNEITRHLEDEIAAKEMELITTKEKELIPLEDEIAAKTKELLRLQNKIIAKEEELTSLRAKLKQLAFDLGGFRLFDE